MLPLRNDILWIDLEWFGVSRKYQDSAVYIDVLLYCNHEKDVEL